MEIKALYIDLLTGRTRIETIPEDVVRRYVGGRGINSYLLYENTEEGMDPLAAESPLIFGAGLLTGMPGPSTSRLTITGKSPESGLFGDSNIGGAFGSSFAATGIHHLVITGRAERPGYLYIRGTEDGPEVELRDAAGIWGLDAHMAQEVLTLGFGHKVQIACIGPAGENQVRFACIMHGEKSAAGRTGMGCLMGNKNLKAIVVPDEKAVSPDAPDVFKTLTREVAAKLKEEFLTTDLSRFGTAHLYNVINLNIEMGRAYNGLSTLLKDKGDLTPERLEDVYYKKKSGCKHCPVSCRHTYLHVTGTRAGLTGEGPEYGVMGHMGPVLGINSLDAVLNLNDTLNRLGLDASSAGNIIAWAIELYKDGIIDDADTGGLSLDWNDPDTVERLMNFIAYRKGFGNTLADGAKAASERFGPESAERLMWVKNMPQSDPVDLRFIKAFALGVGTATRGADHLRSRCPWEAFEFAPELLEEIYGGHVASDPRVYDGKGRVVWWWESFLSLFDALGLCKLLAFHSLPEPGVFGFGLFASLIKAGAGLDMTPEEVFQAGENITTIERRFICREGVSRKDDYPPARYFEPLRWQEGLDEESKVEVLERAGYDRMLDEYYACHGWDSEGRPS